MEKVRERHFRNHYAVQMKVSGDGVNDIISYNWEPEDWLLFESWAKAMSLSGEERQVCDAEKVVSDEKFRVDYRVI